MHQLPSFNTVGRVVIDDLTTFLRPFLTGRFFRTDLRVQCAELYKTFREKRDKATALNKSGLDFRCCSVATQM